GARKSIDAAARWLMSELSRLTSSRSQPSASAIVSATFGKTASMSCWLIFGLLSGMVVSLHLESAVDVQHGAGHVRREVAREEPHGVRDVVDLAVAPQHDALKRLAAGEVAHVLRHLGVDHARRDRVDADLARSELDRHRPREWLDRALARRVVRLAAA